MRHATGRSRPSNLWSALSIDGHNFEMLNLEHVTVAGHVLQDVNAGVAVYYDQRWAVTHAFGRFLLSKPSLVADKTVLVLGAGVGFETVIIGSLCAKLYINDVAPGALELCAWQLRRNGISDFLCLPGNYVDLPLPPVDLMVGCFLVYNTDTARSMRVFLDRHTRPVLLMNDDMPVFRKLIRGTPRITKPLQAHDHYPCLLLTW